MKDLGLTKTTTPAVRGKINGLNLSSEKKERLEELANELIIRLTGDNEEEIEKLKDKISASLAEWGAPFSLRAAASDHKPLARLLACAVVLSE